MENIGGTFKIAIFSMKYNFKNPTSSKSMCFRLVTNANKQFEILSYLCNKLFCKWSKILAVFRDV